ncbi:hypothetical protein LUZ60_008984 [Juncus effusus]|nr:hypothetical protein LUZ60_008984 [Juncus effusus]
MHAHPVPRTADICKHGRKRTTVAKGIQNTMSKTSMLVNFHVRHASPLRLRRWHLFSRNVYYGFMTPSGLALFKSGLGIEMPKDDRYKMTIADLVYALMSVLVFAAIAFADHHVTNCLFPAYKQEMDQVMETFPLMIGTVCSTSFFIFPNTRYDVGCMAT